MRLQRRRRRRRERALAALATPGAALPNSEEFDSELDDGAAGAGGAAGAEEESEGEGGSAGEGESEDAEVSDTDAGVGPPTRGVTAQVAAGSRVLHGKRIVRVSCGGRFTVAVTAGGRVYAWGRADNGRLGACAGCARTQQALAGRRASM
jgi:hypothetical protein